MPTSTVWDQIEALAAERYAAANAPAMVAVHAVETLRAALDALPIRERADVLTLLREELLAVAACPILA